MGVSAPPAAAPRPRRGTRPRLLPALWRGLRRRCPHCGRGALFVRWITLRRQCAECGLVYLRNQGDIWFFWIVMDRIPILAGIAGIYFGFRISNWLEGAAFFLALAGPLVATMPQRQGAAPVGRLDGAERGAVRSSNRLLEGGRDVE